MTNFICYITVGLLFASAIWSVVLASESCSRTAVINYQEVLIDSANSLKGEGLRPYLSKDTQAHSYLEIYQKNARPSFKSSFLVGFIYCKTTVKVAKNLYSERKVVLLSQILDKLVVLPHIHLKKQNI